VGLFPDFAQRIRFVALGIKDRGAGINLWVDNWEDKQTAS